jgi:hypothetical protein
MEVQELPGTLNIEKTDVIAVLEETETDPYFNEINSTRILRAYSDMRAGKNSAEHDLIELNDEENMA